MSRLRLLSVVVLLIVALAAGVGAWVMSQPTTTLVAIPPSSEPPLPSVPTPSTPVPTSTPELDISNPRGEPESLTIKRGEKTVVKTMPFAPRKIYADGSNKFGSACGAVAYWDKAGWPKPGAESLNKSLITGHVMCGNNWYPLQHLQPGTNGKPGGRKGDLLYIQYSSGDLVIGKAKEDSHDVIKSKLNRQEEYIGNGGKKAHEIRLTTCDREGIIRKDGHALNNVVQRFVVIDVIQAEE